MASVKQAWINKYGETEGLKMWEDRKKLSSCTIELFIKKYGEVDGPVKFKEWKSNMSVSRTLVGYIKKFGSDIGSIKYKEKNKNLSVSESALKRSGKTDLEILNIKKKHIENSRITLETMVKKYGDDEGEKKWNNRIYNSKISSKRSIEYWIKKCGNVSDAKINLSNYQRRDKKFYTKKYGEVVGMEKYENAKRKRFLGGFIEPCSVFQKEVEIFIRTVYNAEIRGHENCFCFFPKKDLNQSVVIPDILLTDCKLIIECFGDYWHCSDKYDDNFYHEVIKKTAKEIRDCDERRINFFKENGYDTIVIWESGWKNDKFKQMEKIQYEINKKRNK